VRRGDEETLGRNRKASDMGRENGRCRLSWRLTKLCKTTDSEAREYLERCLMRLKTCPKDEKLISLKA
jgi:hypothetical protein